MFLQSVTSNKPKGGGGKFATDYTYWYERDKLTAEDWKDKPKSKYDPFGNFNGTIEEQLKDIQKKNNRNLKKYYKAPT